MMTQEDRLAAIKMLLSDDCEVFRPYRVAGCLVLVFAQPLQRITELRTVDIEICDAAASIRFDTELVPIPDPLASLLLEHIAHRPNMATATNPDAAWLFPGGSPGQPIQIQNIIQHLKRVGIRLRAGKNSALHQLAKEVPAPVLADMLGFSYQTTAVRAVEAGVDYSAYAALRAQDLARSES